MYSLYQEDQKYRLELGKLKKEKAFQKDWTAYRFSLK